MVKITIYYPHNESRSIEKISNPIPWNIYGFQWQSMPLPNTSPSNPRPTTGDIAIWHSIPDYQTKFTLAHGPIGTDRDPELKMVFSAHSSPFTYHGTASFRNGKKEDGETVPEGEEPGFRIEGAGTITYESGGCEVFDSRFRIVDGSGTKSLTGVKGSGRLWTRVGVHRNEYGDLDQEAFYMHAGRGFGEFVFQRVNEVGKALV
ncbi:MAG: hypothetical protein Q9199_003392 [Rusavskia elegans]